MMRLIVGDGKIDINFLKGFVLCTVIIGVIGCDRLNIGSKNKKNVSNPILIVRKIEDTQLAKVILKRKKHQLDVTKDPFKPLVARVGRSNVQVEVNSVADLKYVGLMKFENKYSALLMTKYDKGVYQKNDKIEGYTIIDIQEDIIVLSNGNQTVELKRGEDN